MPRRTNRSATWARLADSNPPPHPLESALSSLAPVAVFPAPTTSIVPDLWDRLAEEFVRPVGRRRPSPGREHEFIDSVNFVDWSSFGHFANFLPPRRRSPSPVLTPAEIREVEREFWAPLSDGVAVECEVCMEDKTEFYTCETCHRDHCSDCYLGIQNASCPFCREKLRSNFVHLRHGNLRPGDEGYDNGIGVVYD